MAISIEELLKSLQNPAKTGKLENNTDTWNRIANKDPFAELGMEASALESFLKEWISNNPYNH